MSANGNGGNGHHRRAEDHEKDEAKQSAWEVFAEVLRQRGVPAAEEFRIGFLAALDEYESERTTQALRRHGMAAIQAMRDRPVVSGRVR